MQNIINKIKALAQSRTYQIVSAVIIIVVIATLGTVLLFRSHAANNLVLGDYEGAGNVSGVGAFAAETKTTNGIGADYQTGTTWSTIESSYPSYNWTGSPYQLQLGVDMLPSSGGATLADGAAGDYNSYFTTLAQNLVAAGESDAILRIGWEWDQPNSTWYAAGSTTNATNFALYFRQIVTAMRAVSGANFDYDWYYGAASTNGVPGPATAITNDAYPGNSYVSSISLDFYDQTWTGSCNLPYNITTVPTPASQMITAAESNCVWNNSYLPWLNGLASFASSQNKPIGFGEWGLNTLSNGHGLGDDPTFVNNFANWVKANNVIFASYFDINPGLSNGGDSILSAYPQSLAAFISDFGNTSTATPTASPPVTTTTTTTESANAAPVASKYNYGTLVSSTSNGSVYACQLTPEVPVQNGLAGYVAGATTNTIYIKSVTAAKVPKVSPPQVSTSFNGNASTITNFALKVGSTTNYLSVAVPAGDTTFAAGIFNAGIDVGPGSTTISGINPCYTVTTSMVKSIYNVSKSSLGDAYYCITVLPPETTTGQQQVSVMVETDTTDVEGNRDLYYGFNNVPQGPFGVQINGTELQTLGAYKTQPSGGAPPTYLPVTGTTFAAYLTNETTGVSFSPPKTLLLSNMYSCRVRYNY